MSQASDDVVAAAKPKKVTVTVSQIWTSVAIFLVVMVVFSLPLFWWAQRFHPERGLGLAIISFAVCSVSGVLALLVGGLMQRVDGGPSGALLAVAVRFGPPLAGGMLNEQLFGPEIGPVFFKVLLGFYFIALIAETALMVRMIGGLKVSPPKSS